LVERVGHLLPAHRLRRELIAAAVANDTVNRMGITFAFQIAAETGADRADVAGAWWVARGVAALDARFAAIEGLGPEVEARHQIEFAARLAAVGATLSRAYLQRGAPADIAAAIGRDRPVYA